MPLTKRAQRKLRVNKALIPLRHVFLAATFTLKGTSQVKSFHHGTPEGVVFTVNSGDILRESGEVMFCDIHGVFILAGTETGTGNKWVV